jgi:hypothetical protein
LRLGFWKDTHKLCDSRKRERKEGRRFIYQFYEPDRKTCDR